MHNVHIKPVRDIRNNYNEIESLLEKDNPVIITKNGKGSAVLLSIDDYSDYEEFTHVKYIAQKLKEAEDDAESPDAVWSDYKSVIHRLREKYHGL
jgi:prevent-host-death family protein